MCLNFPNCTLGCLSRCIACINQVREKSPVPAELVFASHSLDAAIQPLPKRQKITGKQAAPEFDRATQFETDLNHFIQQVSSEAPRVGKRVFMHGPILQVNDSVAHTDPTQRRTRPKLSHAHRSKSATHTNPTQRRTQIQLTCAHRYNSSAHTKWTQPYTHRGLSHTLTSQTP